MAAHKSELLISICLSITLRGTGVPEEHTKGIVSMVDRGLESLSETPTLIQLVDSTKEGINLKSI